MLALIAFSVAATIVGVGLAFNAGQRLDPSMGSATGEMTFVGADRADVAAARRAFGTIEEIDHQSIAIPGSVDTLDLRAQDPNGKYGHPTLRLVSGRFPTAADDVALTAGAAATLDLHVGDSWTADGVTRRVVGLVENPLNLSDQFALVAPGRAGPPARVTILFDASGKQVDAFRPTGSTADIGTRSTVSKTTAAAVVLALETIGLLFVGLVAAAGFAVMAQRRLRALGMLGALGATDRQVRLAMVANGVVVGVVGAVTGAILGLATWFALAPRFETLVEHRIDRVHLPWWAIAAAIVLAVVTAVIAAWWPARSASRSSIVRALSGRPAPPKPAHRFAGAGALLLAAGLGCLAFAHRGFERAQPVPDHRRDHRDDVRNVVRRSALHPGPGRGRPRRTDCLAPRTARPRPLPGPIGGGAGSDQPRACDRGDRRDQRGLVRGAAGRGESREQPTRHLSQLRQWLRAGQWLGRDSRADPGSRSRAMQPAIDALAASLHAQAVIPLTEAVNAGAPARSPDNAAAEVTATLGREHAVTHGGRHGVEITDEIPLYVATPALLSHFGISPGTVNANTDIVTGRRDLAGYAVIAPSNGPTPCDASQPNCRVNGAKPTPGPAGRGGRDGWQPTMQTLGLPKYTSAPDTLLTAHAMQKYGLEAVAAGWFLQTRSPLTNAQISSARRTAAAAGITVETRQTPTSNAGLRNGATAVGLLVAVGVLAMTVGLIRSETANEIRTLAATGATSTTRRTITGATAGALALLGALLGTCGAYLAADGVAPK